MSKVNVKNVVKALNLEVIYGNSFLDNLVTKPTSSRPSVEIYAGYFDYFEKDRIQVIGTKELTLFNMLSKSLKQERLEKMFSYKSPAYVFTKNVDAPSEFIEAAIKYQVPILKSKASTSGFIGELTNYLQSELAPRLVVEGSALEVHGVGVMITGIAGIGKSETALELIKKNHIMVSDDLTRIYQPEPGSIICEATPEKQKIMEIKDIGMIDVEKVFGIGSIRHHKRLQLIVELTHEENKKPTTVTLFDTPIKKIYVQVEAGRNVATLVETAALNYRASVMGIDTKKDYEKRIKHSIVKED